MAAPAPTFKDRTLVSTATTGTGTITLGSAVSGYQDFATAGFVTNDIVPYIIRDGATWEVGIGTYNSGAGTLTRTVIQSSSGTSKLNLSGSATAGCDWPAFYATHAAAVLPPQGRLTTTTAVPVLTSDVTAATTIYYTPYQGNSVPVYDATTGQLVNRVFTERSQATTDTTKSPAACIAYSNYDMFVWDDAGTLRCTRGPAWVQAQTFTVTIATPAVVTATGHGLKEGFPWVPTSTGSLPTGMTAGTTYFVIATGLTANAFEFSATAGGAAVNTSGSQSGVHTSTDSNLVRGTGAGTTELEFANGFYRNKNAITNGPGAGLGIYVGTVRTNSSSQIDMIFGGTGAAGGESTFLGVWNAYNRRPTKLSNFDNTDSWNYTTLTWRCKNAGATGNGYNNRIQVVVGLKEDVIELLNSPMAQNASTNTGAVATVALNTTVAYDVGRSIVGRTYSALGSQPFNFFSGWRGQCPLGYSQFFPLEEAAANGTMVWYGDNGDNGAGTGERYGGYTCTIFA